MLNIGQMGRSLTPVPTLLHLLPTMKLHQVRVALLATAAALAIAAGLSTIRAAELPVVPATTQIVLQQQDSAGSGDQSVRTISAQVDDAVEGTDIVKVAIWTAVGVTIGGVVLGTFYLLKRRMGGFPENPPWVAPITIMESKDFPDEDTFGDQVPSEQAHAEH